jgi:TolB-like protein
LKTKGKRACPVCGTLFADNSESCPVCALQGALKPESDSVSDVSSELRFEHYTVLKNADGTPLELGHGAMGVTYKAFDVHLFPGHLGSFFNQRGVETIPTEKSIAVLPFENISANKDDAYFADGVQDEILNNLAKIAQLRVTSRTSVMQYRTDNKRDLRQIASALGVANVLEGTVRRDGNHVHVSTELVDARNDNTIWADSYDRDLTNIFSIQSEIAQTVASRLSAQLSPEERKDIQEKPTNNLEAYDLYLQAKELIANTYLEPPLILRTRKLKVKREKP